MALKWPAKALGAIVALFRPLQDIDVFVEDKDSEAFYEQLLSRVVPDGIRLKRVFPLLGRQAVLDKAKGHDLSSRPALFLVDGDYEWVRGEPAPNIPGVYRLGAYCIENLLVCEKAATVIVMECLACAETEAQAAISFATWRTQVAPLVDLFIAWAAQNKVQPATPTTSQGVSPFLDGKGGETKLDQAKVTAAAASAEATTKNEPNGQAVLDAVRARVVALADPLHAVSGKDFLLPILDYHLRSVAKAKIRRKELVFRLARHVDTTRLAGVAAALKRASAGENQHAA